MVQRIYNNYNTPDKKEKILKWYMAVICFISVVFFGIMGFLTFEARNIHEKSLPHIKYQKLGIIPESAIHNGSQVFIIKTCIKNGEERTFAESRVIVKGKKIKDGYKIDSGIDIWDNVIIWSDQKISDGAEVVVKKQE